MEGKKLRLKLVRGVSIASVSRLNCPDLPLEGRGDLNLFLISRNLDGETNNAESG